jgi:hypothetical protein
MYMFIYRHQNAGQNYNTNKGIKSFENVAKFVYVGTTLTHRNCVQEEIKSGLNSGNYLLLFSLQSFVFPSAARKCQDWGIQNYNFAFVCVYVKLVPFYVMLRTVSGAKSEKGTRGWQNCILSSLRICTVHQLSLGWSKWRRMRWVFLENMSRKFKFY